MELKEQDLIDEIISTLDYYADKKTYQGQAFGGEWVAPIEHDSGQRARKVINRIRGRVIEAIKLRWMDHV